MNTSSIVMIVVIVVVVLAIAVVWHHAKHHITYSDRQLADTVSAIFAEAGADAMPKKKFLHVMKHRISCTHKDLLYLYGKCRQAGLIVVDGDTVRKK